MGGFIILDDGRAWSPASWSYDAAIEAIAAALSAHPPLSAWLMEQRCSVRGPGLGRVDVRELTAENRRLFLAAVPRAVEASRAAGSSSWSDPAMFPPWLESFQRLAGMIEAVARGEPPSTVPSAPTGHRSGPGWT